MSSARQQRTIFSTAPALLLLGLLTACSSFSPQPDARRGADTAARPDSSTASHAAAVALQQVGAPYRYGGSSPRGFDCSGLVQFAYRKAGKQLPRTTAQLWSTLPAVSREDIRIGDVLFFKVGGKMSHVGVYLGDDRFVHAPSTGRTVAVASLDSPYYDAALLRAGRPR